HERKALQHVSVGEVLAGGDELALVLLALLVGQTPPGGIDPQERVLHEVARAHSAIIAAPHGRATRGGSRTTPTAGRVSACGSRCSRRTRGPTPGVSPATSRRSHTSCSRPVTRRGSSRRSIPTTG